jgi:hypothetical protein
MWVQRGMRGSQTPVERVRQTWDQGLRAKGQGRWTMDHLCDSGSIDDLSLVDYNNTQRVQVHQFLYLATGKGFDFAWDVSGW